jgi:hypothetical protein
MALKMGFMGRNDENLMKSERLIEDNSLLTARADIAFVWSSRNSDIPDVAHIPDPNVVNPWGRGTNSCGRESVGPGSALLPWKTKTAFCFAPGFADEADGLIGRI